MISYFKRKRKRGSKILPFFFAFFLLVLIGFLIISNWRLQEKRSEFDSQLKILSKKIQDLEGRNQELRQKISGIFEENYLEKVAREKLNLKKPGEEVVVIKKERVSPLEVQKEEEKKNFFNFQNWFNWLKNKLGN